MNMKDVDAAMEATVAAPGNPIISKCQAASVAYTVVDALAKSAGLVKGAILRWVAGKISEYQRANCE